MNPTSFAQAIRTEARALLTGVGALLVFALLLGLLLTGLRPPVAEPRDPDPVYRPARTSPDSNDLESRVTAIERQQQRERDRRNAELFAPQYAQPTMVPFEPSYPKIPSFEPSSPRTDPLAPSSRSLDWMGW